MHSAMKERETAVKNAYAATATSPWNKAAVEQKAAEITQRAAEDLVLVLLLEDGHPGKTGAARCACLAASPDRHGSGRRRTSSRQSSARVQRQDDQLQGAARARERHLPVLPGHPRPLWADASCRADCGAQNRAATALWRSRPLSGSEEVLSTISSCPQLVDNTVLWTTALPSACFLIRL